MYTISALLSLVLVSGAVADKLFGIDFPVIAQVVGSVREAFLNNVDDYTSLRNENTMRAMDHEEIRLTCGLLDRPEDQQPTMWHVPQEATLRHATSYSHSLWL